MPDGYGPWYGRTVSAHACSLGLLSSRLLRLRHVCGQRLSSQHTLRQENPPARTCVGSKNQQALLGDRSFSGYFSEKLKTCCPIPMHSASYKMRLAPGIQGHEHKPQNQGTRGPCRVVRCSALAVARRSSLLFHSTQLAPAVPQSGKHTTSKCVKEPQATLPVRALKFCLAFAFAALRCAVQCSM